MITDSIFFSIGIIIVVSSLLGLLAKFLRQPLIPAYVATGLLLGPILNLIPNEKQIAMLSEIGVAFLLFIVGLEIDLSKLKNVGLVSSLGGIIQSVTLFSLGFIIALFIGLKSIEALYIGIMIAFSSTMVVIKILSDKRELDTLHGRIILGFLLMEDIMAILAISFLSQLNQFSFLTIIVAAGKALLVLIISWFASKHIFPRLFRFAAKSQELLFLTAVGVCFSFSLFFASLSFSITIGAFAAGVALANLPYSFEIISRVKSIRDFFSTIFFVSLGTAIVGISSSKVLLLILLLLVIWLIKPFITVFVTSFFGYKKRPSFLVGISLAQISEFALIIGSIGLVNGHIDNEIFSLVVMLAVISMSTTSYFVKYELYIYNKMQNMLKRFEKLSCGESKVYEYAKQNKKYDVLLIGYDRIGFSIVKKLHIMKKKLIIVDFNPEVIKRLIKEKIHCIYGDITEPEIIDRINLKNIEMVISTTPEIHGNKILIQSAKRANSNALVFVTAYKVKDALALYDAGADYVIIPHFLGGDHVSLLIERFDKDEKEIINHKLVHIEELKHRQMLGHEQIRNQNPHY